MKTMIAVLAFLAVASAATITTSEPIRIISQDSYVGPDGSHLNKYETGNGIQVEERGAWRNSGIKGDQVRQVVGWFSYTAPDGTPIKLKYVANENGFVAIGDHLPVAPVDTNTPPPVPVAILRSLEWNAAHPGEELVKNVN